MELSKTAESFRQRRVTLLSVCRGRATMGQRRWVSQESPAHRGALVARPATLLAPRTRGGVTFAFFGSQPFELLFRVRTGTRVVDTSTFPAGTCVGLFGRWRQGNF